MGQEIEQACFSEANYQEFREQLQNDLLALEVVLAWPGFGDGEPTIGIELELNLVDAAGQPLPRNVEILKDLRDPRVKPELDRFNLEINGSPLPLRGKPFTALGAETAEILAAVRRGAAAHGGRVVMVGILPTLRTEHLQPEALTDTARYRALSDGLRHLRRGPLRLRIDGEDPLELEWDDATFEGANTSLQVHLRVPASEFADMYNAAQLATAPVLACAGNSPLFLAHRLWSETRIALFRQAAEDRDGLPGSEWRPARVSFGNGWVRRSAHELFAESVTLHAPLLPVPGRERDPVAVARAGGVPQLCALRLHHGTVWRWNRAVYDPSGGGHLRIEMRALPAGPTLLDMQANAALALGLTLGLRPYIGPLLAGMTFAQARRNFYAAARYGLDAELFWPCAPGELSTPSPRPRRAAELITELLPLARRGLLEAGVDACEIDALLEVIAARVLSQKTGARWQQHALTVLEREQARREALTAMLERYLRCADTGEPVHLWPLP
jgi:gamma-glutamyl:cysteine ligase YbdK (ATP-grasp superfamily)